MAKTKKIKLLKTYVITVSVKFPKKGIVVPKPTGFKKKILSGEKKHTVRLNYKFWKKRIDQINKGNAILSVRQWTGLPYRSKQVEIKRFKQGEVGYEGIVVYEDAIDVAINTGKDEYYLFLSDKQIKKLAKNDGLTLQQFQDWFKHGASDGIIIHFSRLRYNKQK